jgi:hypothetical protein
MMTFSSTFLRAAIVKHQVPARTRPPPTPASLCLCPAGCNQPTHRWTRYRSGAGRARLLRPAALWPLSTFVHAPALPPCPAATPPRPAPARCARQAARQFDCGCAAPAPRCKEHQQHSSGCRPGRPKRARIARWSPPGCNAELHNPDLRWFHLAPPSDDSEKSKNIRPGVQKPGWPDKKVIPCASTRARRTLAMCSCKTCDHRRSFSL